jgi:hypothetical protein
MFCALATNLFVVKFAEDNSMPCRLGGSIAQLLMNRYNELFGHVQRVDEKLATASFGSKTKGVTRNRAKTTH